MRLERRVKVLFPFLWVGSVGWRILYNDTVILSRLFVFVHTDFHMFEVPTQSKDSEQDQSNGRKIDHPLLEACRVTCIVQGKHQGCIARIVCVPDS